MLLAHLSSVKYKIYLVRNLREKMLQEHVVKKIKNFKPR